jgi:hypothetical protein
MGGVLSRDEFLSTFVEPMRRLEADETYKPIPICDYVADCFREFDPAVGKDRLEIQHIYLNGDKSFYHVLIHYGLHNRFLAIVVDCGREAVHGHYLLDLNGEYGVNDS